MAARHQIVIIGASFAGLPAAHGLLKDVLPTLSSEKKAYKVTMISPSSYFWFKIAAPRVIVNPKAIPTEKALIPIRDSFKKYSAEQFEFIEAYVTSIDATAKTLSLSNSGSVAYDTLVIASGTTLSSPVWTLSGGIEPMKAALRDLQERIPGAESILVVGGGPAGTETTGELAELYGGKKDITFLTGSAQPLNSLSNKKLGQEAEARLIKSGIKVVNKVRVVSSKKEGGKDIVQLSDGTTKTVDVYIDATGDKPNNKFFPADWINEKGYVKTDPNTLRLDVPGVTGVYCIGSAGSYSNGAAFDAKFSQKPLLESIKLDLQGTAPGPRTKNIYKKFQSEVQIVPLGSAGGVGVLFGYKIPNFMVKMIKAKDFMISTAQKTVEGTG